MLSNGLIYNYAQSALIKCLYKNSESSDDVNQHILNIFYITVLTTLQVMSDFNSVLMPSLSYR